MVGRHGTIVGNDDLLRFAWPNAVVGENNLIAITSDRLFLPMTESAETICMVEGVDH